jgi:ADP-ribose pyrophosphatase
MTHQHSRTVLGPDDVDIVGRAVVYDGYTRVDELQLRHRRHDGGWTPVIKREMIERGHAVAVLPYDPVRDEVVLIRQFRVGAWGAGRNPWLIETVAGIIDPGETAEDVARRESLEEAGCRLTALIPVCEYFTSPGILTETAALYVGITDSSAAGSFHGLEHEGEDIEAFVLTWRDALASMRKRRFLDVKIVMALQWLALNRAGLRRKYGTP